MGIVIGVFKKLTVKTGVDFFLNGIIASVPFLSNPIPNKNTFNGSWFKFISDSFWEMNIDNTSEHPWR